MAKQKHYTRVGIYVSCVVLLLRHLFFPPHLFG